MSYKYVKLCLDDGIEKLPGETLQQPKIEKISCEVLSEQYS
jgi:hypothetical protein